MSNDVDSERTAPQTDASEPVVQETLFGLLVRAIRDGLIGAVAGLAGSVAVLGTLLLTDALGGFSMDSFARFPELFGLDAALTGNQVVLVGIAFFVVGGMVVWPLVLATIGMYLPGKNYATGGLFFGVVIWTGFVLYFYTGVAGAGLAIYIVLSLVGHLGYGYVMGATMDRLFGETGPLVSFVVRNPEAAATDAGGRTAESQSTSDAETKTEPAED